MRLFIAINLSEEEKEQVLSVQNLLKDKAMRGSFTKQENFHLTLAFLGEIRDSQVLSIQKIMDDAPCGTFSLCFDKIGTFHRTGGNIYYLAAKPEKESVQLAEYLRKTLSHQHFEVDDKPFVPHLTLVREAVVADDKSIKVSPITLNVTKISLMKSERLKGVLTYTSIYDKIL
jgi:2''-5'' RNA ligase